MEEMYIIKDDLVYSRSKHFQLYQAQPRYEEDWVTMEEEYQQAGINDAIASEYWNQIKCNVFYLGTFYNYHKNRKRSYSCK